MKEIRCDCGKLLCMIIEEGGIVQLWCRKCSKNVTYPKTIEKDIDLLNPKQSSNIEEKVRKK